MIPIPANTRAWLAAGVALLGDLRDRVSPEIVGEVPCVHQGLLASKLANKASTKHGAIYAAAVVGITNSSGIHQLSLRFGGV